MEFNRLADVEVVETANDADKVLIEQGGEIKRVPKTEVGGGGKMFIGNATVNPDTYEITDVTTNMTLDETIKAFDNRELTGAIVYLTVNGEVGLDILSIVNMTPTFGKPCALLLLVGMGAEIYWTAEGFSIEEPTPAEA